VPAPIVVKLPAAVKAVVDAVIPTAVIVRLLKEYVPAPLTVLPGPFKIIVPVFPVSVPLLERSPEIVCEKLPDPPLNVVAAPIVKFPVTVMALAAVYVTPVPLPIELVKFPATVNAVPGIVFTTDPLELLRIRFPYE
jgi:hypothetical protein